MFSTTKANIKLVDDKTPEKTDKEIFQLLLGVDLLFIEQKAKQHHKYVDIAKKSGVTAAGVFNVPIPEEDKEKICIR